MSYQFHLQSGYDGEFKYSPYSGVFKDESSVRQNAYPEDILILNARGTPIEIAVEAGGLRSSHLRVFFFFFMLASLQGRKLFLYLLIACFTW